MQHRHAYAFEVKVELVSGPPTLHITTIVVPERDVHRGVAREFLEHRSRGHVAGMEDHVGTLRLVEELRGQSLREIGDVGVGDYQDAQASLTSASREKG